MATPKKPVAKATVAKKPAIAPAKSKEATGKSASAKGLVAAQKSGAVTKTAPAKASAPAKKAAAVSAAPSKNTTASPAKAAAAQKSASGKNSAPSKASAPVKKTTEPTKSASAKKAATAPAATAKTTTKKDVPAPAPVKAIKKPEPKVAAPAVEGVADTPVVKKETKAQQRAAQKRTASAVQRVQAKVAAAMPKPQPKPAPMPTVMPGRDEKKSNVIVAHRRLESKPKEEEDNSMTMINYQPDFTRSILDRGDKDNSGPLYRYSDDELAEFRDLISSRLATARKELSYQQGLITHKDATGTEDSDNRYMNMEDGSGAMEREQLSQLASRQIQFINHLEKAMVRIENKTYGICRVTGKLIDKARLRAVPHATLSIEAKNLMSK